MRLVHQIWTDKNHPDLVHIFFGESEDDVKAKLEQHYNEDKELFEAVESQQYDGKKCRVVADIDDVKFNGEIVKVASNHLRLIKGGQSDIPGHEDHSSEDCNVRTG